MKTSIAHNNNVSLSKGILISAYIHNSAAYVLLDGNRGYILRAENQEEEERIAAFVRTCCKSRKKCGDPCKSYCEKGRYQLFHSSISSSNT